MVDVMPAEAFPPGGFLRDELEERGWTQTEFAEILGRPVTLVNDIINGKRGITPTTAMEIAAALGTTPMLWMNLDASYQLWKLAETKPRSDRIKISARVRERYPVRDMIARGWIHPSEDPEVLELRVCQYFHVESLDETPALAHAAKKGVKADENYSDLTPAQLAWLFRVKQIAETMEVSDYSERALREALPQLWALMAEPEEARHVPTILAGCGVRFVIVEPLPSSKIDGVCFWLENRMSAPVIGMSLRFDRIDNFWFVLRHEIEHVLRQNHSFDSELEPTTSTADSNLPEEEQIANAAAAEFSVPEGRLSDFVRRVHPLYSEQRVVGFSRVLGIHPGIAVGQLQKKLGRYDFLRKYLVKVRDIVTQSAITDGYGRLCPVTF
jgi:HTH-type transcriptional regulator/antitoxin HigA